MNLGSPILIEKTSISLLEEELFTEELLGCGIDFKKKNCCKKYKRKGKHCSNCPKN